MLAAGAAQAQGWGGMMGAAGPWGSQEAVTLDGTLLLINGHIAITNDESTYFVLRLGGYAHFIEGIRAGAEVSIDGFVFGNFLQPASITIEGITHDLGFPSAGGWGGMMPPGWGQGGGPGGPGMTGQGMMPGGWGQGAPGMMPPGWGGGMMPPAFGMAQEPVTVAGTLLLVNGHIAISNDESTYFVLRLGGYASFVDGIRAGAEVSIDGFVFGNFLQPASITIDGITHDLGFPAAGGWGGGMMPPGWGF